MSGSRARAVLFAGLLGGFLLLASGCGGSKPPSVANLGTTTTTPQNPAATAGGTSRGRGGPAVAFAACIRKHGDPTLPPSTPENPFGGGDTNSPQFLQAERKCAAIMPQNAPPQAHTENTGPLVAFVACMRKHGMPDLPDPDNKGYFPRNAFNGIDPHSTLFQSAVTTCQPLLHGESIGIPQLSQGGAINIPGP